MEKLLKFLVRFGIITLGFYVVLSFFTIVPSVLYYFSATLVLFKITWDLWLHYVRQNFISGINYVLLEIVPPREILRSPKAMELFLINALYHHSVKGGLETYWIGAVWFWYSLEIASIDGQVHFYIRTPTRIRPLIETQMYAQYPQAQIREVEDYTYAVKDITEKGEWDMWGCEFGLERHQAWPIKTYVDFGLDKDPKEEQKVDPISPVIELFAALKKGEQMWLQYVITPSKQEYHTKGTWFGTHDWIEESKEVFKDATHKWTSVNARLPKYTEDKVKPILNKITKIGFDVGIRTCYVAKKEAFDGTNRRALRLIFRQYSNPFANSLIRINSTQADALGGGGFLGSFVMLPNEKVTLLKNRMLNDYRDRSFYHQPLRTKLFSKLPWPISPMIFPNYFNNQIMVLNVEEISTLWHFPGQILKVPTLERIESKEAAPPVNLPM